MAGLPGLSLPGLNLSTPTPQTISSIAPAIVTRPRTEELPARSELRFEVAFNKAYKVRLTRGNAEIFGTELAPNITYTFTGAKAAVFSWTGCSLELQGDAESEYVGTETEAMVEWMNVHGMIETVRDEANMTQDGGPRVLVLGAGSTGKTSLVKCLTAWGLRMGRTPTVVNVDSREGMLGIPGALTAVTYNTMLDVEEDGWGTSAISGPTNIPVKTPLVYHYPFPPPENNDALYKNLTTRMALAVTSRMEEDASVKQSGLIIDTPSVLNQPKNNYELAHHIISEFSINIILVLGSERLYNDLNRRYSKPASTTDEAVTVLRISSSPGAIPRDESFSKSYRSQQIRQYFFGDSRSPLNPHGQTWDFSELSIWRALDPNVQKTSISFLPGMDDDDDYDPSTTNNAAKNKDDLFEKVAPNQGLVNCVLAIKFAAGNAGQEAIRDSCVMGFVYVAEVDETRKKVRVLAPHPTRWGDRALVWGPWPEGVGDLVA